MYYIKETISWIVSCFISIVCYIDMGLYLIWTLVRYGYRVLIQKILCIKSSRERYTICKEIITMRLIANLYEHLDKTYTWALNTIIKFV